MKRGWDESSARFLKENFGKLPVKEIAAYLGKSVETVRWKSRELNLPSGKGKWTKREIDILTWYMAHKEPQEVAEMVGRSERAVISKASALGITRTRGTWSLAAIVRKTGYTKEQILRAREALRQRWDRAGTVYRINEEQLADLIAYLAMPARFVTKSGAESDKWAQNLRLDACAYCGSAGSAKDEQHVAFGLCRKCHRSLRKLILMRYKIMAMYMRALYRRGFDGDGIEHPYALIKDLGGRVRMKMRVKKKFGSVIIFRFYARANRSRGSQTQKETD